MHHRRAHPPPVRRLLNGPARTPGRPPGQAPGQTPGPRRWAAVLPAALLILAACAPPHDPAPAARPASEGAPAAAPTRPADPVRPPAPAELVGLDSRALDRLLGPPELVRRDGGAEIRLYRGTACTLHLFLYPRDGTPRATYLEARSRAGRLSAGEEARCLHAIAARPG